MIEHIVLFKLKAGTDEATRLLFQDELRKLKALIPEIVDLTIGENFSQRSQGFEIGLVVRFRDQEGLDTYQEHPAHQKVVQTIVRPNLADILAIDYHF